MINLKEEKLTKKIEKTKRKARWNKGRRSLSHHSSEIILRDR
jgi:hypothetical protein